MVADCLTRLWDARLNQDPYFHVFGCMLVVLILGLLLVQLRGPRSRWVGLLGLGGLCWAVCSDWLPMTTFATSSYWNGEVSMLTGGFQYENPDHETRLTVRPSCVHIPHWNETLLLNARLFGPPPGAYVGPYPTQLEAADLLRRQGELPSISGSRLLLGNGSTFPLLVTSRQWWDDAQGEGLTNLHFELGVVRRVAYLSETSILTETYDRIELRIWDRLHHGEIWATWDK